ncbi:chlorophyll a/b-binding protein domain-containing protein [Pelagophyceae sp. CCMP2097]|nr:chlorophyll a/b-binding protein domain-containing protein [Pelagophyceae sp. CCMP2097]
MLSSLFLVLGASAVSGFAPQAPARAATAQGAKVLKGVGITDSFPGFFDPLGLAAGASADRLKFYREAELKHSRVAMLAATGFLVGEGFHPLFGGEIDLPSYVAFQSTPLQQFWPVVLWALFAIEGATSIPTFENPFVGGMWVPKQDHDAGDLGFDPLGLLPESKAEAVKMATMELNNGRLAMIGIAGMVGQELVTGAKIF